MSPTLNPTSTDYLALSAFFLSYAVILVSRYPSRCVGTKARPDLPGPVGVPLVGNMFQLFAQSARMIGYLGDLEQKYGPVFTFTMPYWGRNIVVNRPEWLEHVRKSEQRVFFLRTCSRSIISLQGTPRYTSKETSCEMYLVSSQVPKPPRPLMVRTGDQLGR